MSGSSSRALLLAVVAGGVACFRTTAPPGYLPTATEAATSAYGGWIRVEKKDGVAIEGELLAAMGDTLHVRTPQWTTIPLVEVQLATLTGYRVPLGPNTAWAVLGGISTISHGGFLLLTAPAWAIAGVSAAASASRAPRIISLDPLVLRTYARFPQGVPPGLDRSAVAGKPPT